MKYKVLKTDLLHKGILIHENSTIEMTEKEAEEFSEFLVPEKPAQQKIIPSSTAETKTKKPGKKRITKS